MKTTALYKTLAGLMLSTLTLPAAMAHELGSNMKPIAFGNDQTIIDFDKVAWQPLDVEGLDPGVEIALIRGDLAKDGSEVVLKIPAGYHVAMHTHTSDETYIWLKGAYTLISEDGKKHSFRSGTGYISFPGNAPKHAITCDAEDYCLTYIKWSRPFDILY